MEIQEALRIGYSRELHPAVVFGGNPVLVYGEGSVPENLQEPYIILSTFTGGQRFTDTGKVYEVTQLVDVVTASLGPSGYGAANNIADQVEALINPENRVDIDITDLGYRIGNTFQTATDELFLKSKTKYVYRVLKRYRHVVSKQEVIT